MPGPAFFLVEVLADLLVDELLEALLLGEGVRLRPPSLEDEEVVVALFLLANSASRLGARELTTASSALLSLMFKPAEDSMSFFANLSLLLDLARRCGLDLLGLVLRPVRTGDRLL